MELKTFELKSVDGERGTFEGLLSVYGNVDRQGDLVKPGAYAETLQANNYRVPLLWQHDQAQPIGTLTLEDSAVGLKAKGRLLLSVSKAREAYDLLREGIVKGLSIGYQAIDPIKKNGVRILQKLELFEGSLVTVAANPLAVVSSVKANGQTVSDAQLIAALDEVFARHCISPAREEKEFRVWLRGLAERRAS